MLRSFLCHDEKLDEFIEKGKLFEGILNYDVCKALGLMEKDAEHKLQNIKSTNLQHALLNLSNSLPKDNLLKFDSNRYVLSFPDTFPSCFTHVRTSANDENGLYQSIRLYRGIISSNSYLLCDICHPHSLHVFNEKIKGFGHNVAAAIRTAKVDKVICFPSLPHLYLANSVYANRVGDIILREVELNDFDNYLDQVELLAKAFVSRVSSIAYNTCFKSIEMYYGSIYTHAITWHLSTRELQIKFRTDSSFWPSLFEKSITRLKGNESYGICCGLLATHDIAEAFLTFIDNKLHAALSKKFHGCSFHYTRRMDTFCFQSASITSKQFSEIFEDVIEEFNLLPSKKDLEINNFTHPDFKLREFMLNNDFNQAYLQGKFDQDLICLIMFKKLRDTGYSLYLDQFKPCLLHCAEVIPFIVEFVINDFQAFVTFESTTKEALLNLAHFIIENCKDLSKRSIQHLSILWLDCACDINSKYLVEYTSSSAPSIFFYKLMEHIRLEPITAINDKYIEFKNMSPLFTSQLSLDIFSSLSLHRLVKILVLHKGDEDLADAVVFAKRIQRYIKCTVHVRTDDFTHVHKYDVVYIQVRKGVWDSKTLADCQIDEKSEFPKYLVDLKELKYKRPNHCTCS